MIIVYILKVIVISWMIGHASAIVLRGTNLLGKLWQFNFVKNEKTNELIGVGVLKWVLVNSFIKYFNRQLHISDKKPSLNQLSRLREEMTYAEVVHLVGFVYVTVRVILNIGNSELAGATTPLLVANMITNFYPALLQQLNKRRLDRLTTRTRCHVPSS